MNERKGSSKDTKYLYASLRRSLFLCFVSLFAIVTLTVAWFVNNSLVNSNEINISADDNADFILATVGDNEQGVYDNSFGLEKSTDYLTYGDKNYYLIKDNKSFRTSLGSNLNNIINGQEIRPGSRGQIELYVICKNENRIIKLKAEQKLFSNDNETLQAEHLRYANAHIMLFLLKENDGTYDRQIDYNVGFQVDLNNSLFSVNVYSDSEVKIYKLTFYWVWPESLHNIIYPNRTYNKNLFNNVGSYAYKKINNELNGSRRGDYFIIDSNEGFPETIDINMTTEDYFKAMKAYNEVDEEIGSKISHIEFSIELVE